MCFEMNTYVNCGIRSEDYNMEKREVKIVISDDEPKSWNWEKAKEVVPSYACKVAKLSRRCPAP